MADVDSPICIKPEVLDEAAARDALARRKVDRQIDEMSLRTSKTVAMTTGALFESSNSLSIQTCARWL